MGMRVRDTMLVAVWSWFPAGDVASSGSFKPASSGADFGAVKLCGVQHHLRLRQNCGFAVKPVQGKSSTRHCRKAAKGETGEGASTVGNEGDQSGEDGDSVADLSKPTVDIEIAPSVLQQIGSCSGGTSSVSNLIDQNQEKRRQQKQAASARQKSPSKLDAHLSALNQLLGETLSSSSPLPDSGLPLSADKYVAVEKSDDPKEDQMIQDRIRYGMSLLNRPPTDTGILVELDIDTAEWWYPRAVLFWTTLVGSVARMKEVEDNEGAYVENMDREAALVVRALVGDLDPKEALDTNFPHVQTGSDMVSGLFVGADCRGINEDENTRKEWLFLADMYSSQLQNRPSLLSTWDERDWLLKNVFADSSFTVVGEVLRCQHGLLFFGTISGKSAAQTRAELQERLEKNYFFNLMPILLKQVRPEEEVQCLVCPPQSILSLRIPKIYEDAIFVALSVGVALGSSQMVAADPGLDFVSLWERSVVPLGLLAVSNVGHLVRRAVASSYNVSHQIMKPWFLPVPNVGALATFTPYVGCLPSRKCLLDLSIYSNVASFLLSSLFILASFSPSLSPQGLTDTVADLRGFVAVPSDLLAYSGPLTWLMNQLSVATSSEDGGISFMSPWALAGILGLHITAMGLLPIGVLDGGRIVTGLLGRGGRFLRFLLYVTVAASIGATASYLSTAAWSLFMLLVTGDDWYQLDEVTEPDPLTKIISSILVLVGVACFLVPLTALPSTS